MFKKTISMLLLTATISMTVAVPGYAAMKITDANSFKWSQTGSEWKVVDGSGNPATGFVILSFLRKKINSPRPYEVWEIVPLLDRDSSGQSMPSRHVFSATIISMACLHASLTMGMICLTLSAFLGLVRVLGGVHYPKDVVVGYICGLVWGVIFFLC